MVQRLLELAREIAGEGLLGIILGGVFVGVFVLIICYIVKYTTKKAQKKEEKEERDKKERRDYFSPLKTAEREREVKSLLEEMESKKAKERMNQ
jgi:type VI protein secretion system component VasK